MVLRTQIDLGQIGHPVPDQKVCRVQLRDQADRVVLGRCFGKVAFFDKLLDLVHAALPIHQANEIVGRRCQTVKAPALAVLDDAPGNVAIDMFVNLNMPFHAQPQLRNAVPVRAEDAAHAYPNQRQRVSRSQSTKLLDQFTTTSCWSSSILATPFIPGRSLSMSPDENEASTRNMLRPSRA